MQLAKSASYANGADIHGPRVRICGPTNVFRQAAMVSTSTWRGRWLVADLGSVGACR
jgi:hypothetical protein